MENLPVNCGGKPAVVVDSAPNVPVNSGNAGGSIATCCEVVTLGSTAVGDVEPVAGALAAAAARPALGAEPLGVAEAALALAPGVVTDAEGAACEPGAGDAEAAGAFGAGNVTGVKYKFANGYNAATTPPVAAREYCSAAFTASRRVPVPDS